MKSTKELPDLEEIVRFFYYDPVSGLLINKQDRGTNCFKGTVAGHESQRYRTVWLGGRKLMQHRVAYRLMTGEDPPGEIDHINRNGKDNRWENLRVVDRSVNCINTATRKDNALKERCIHYSEALDKFIVQIQRNKKRKSWLFNTIGEAIKFRDSFLKELGEC